jgi:hypothetical protein
LRAGSDDHRSARGESPAHVGGVDLAAASKLCDGAILCCYDMEPDAVADGLRVFYPEVSGPAVLAARAKAAVDAGADGVNFYNYGLIPAKRLDWVKAAVDAIT